MEVSKGGTGFLFTIYMGRIVGKRPLLSHPSTLRQVRRCSIAAFCVQGGMMSKQISLSRGLFAIVDDEDFEWLNQWKWSVHIYPNGLSYATRALPRATGKKMILMHRLILDAPKGTEVDHRDGDGLNNQRSNIRQATHAQNNSNKGLQSNTTSGVRGVCFDKRRGKWRVEVNANKKRYWIGYFDSLKDATNARNEAAKELHGEFVLLSSCENSQS